jgi:hypothetical protein
MDQVKIRAAVAAHGLAKDAEVTVAETPIVAGAINNGVFVLLERNGEPIVPPTPEPQDGEDDETPVPPVENVELPDADTEPEEPPVKPKASPRRRG